MNSFVEQVNELLRTGEPGNISVDEHSGYTGYKPQVIIDTMNEVLWGQWGFDEVSSEIVPGDKGALAVAQVRVWLKDIEFKPVGWGQNRVTRGDIGDARKGAQTDAIKKALSYFSIGSRAYHGLLDAKSKSNGHAQPQPAKRVIDAPLPAQATDGIPTPAQLRTRCDAVCGRGFWGPMLQKVFKVEVMPGDDDLTPDDCLKIVAYLDKAEAMKSGLRKEAKAS